MKGGLQQRNETKENPMSVGKPFGRSNKVAPLVPQIEPIAKPGTFIDDDFQSISPYSQSTSSSKTGSPVRSGRIKMFSVEGDTPYAVDIGAAFGHGTQSAIDSLAEDIDEEMVKIDKKLRGVVRSANSSKVMSIKERKKTKFAVQRTKKKIKSSLHKMRMVREGVVHGGTSFMYSSSDDDDGGGDEDAVMTGLEHHDKSLNAVGSAQLFKPLDPNIKKQLIVALKMKRTYKSALTDVSEKYRKSLAELDKLHGELANMQSELEIAHTQATRRGGGIGGSAAFAVSNVNESKRDEEDRARRDRERKKLLSAAGGGDGEDDLAGDIDSNQPQALKLCNKIGKCYSKYKPLRQDVSKIEQRFGTSVASYFHFYQWMFLNSIIVWLLYVLGFGYHLYINTNLCTTSNNTVWTDKLPNETQKDVQFIACRPRGLCQVTNQVGVTPCHGDIHCPANGKCLMQYDYFPYLNLLDRIPFAFRTSTAGSWVPELFMFSSFTASEAWIYTCMLLISIFVMMIQTVIKWSAEDRKLKMINAFEGSRASQNKYAKLVLNSWDHNLQTVREIRDHKLFIAESLRMLVQDAKAAESSSSRTLKQKVVLYLRRGFFIFLYIVIQTGGMALIVITLAGQSEYIKLADDWLFENTGGALEITPIVVGIVNGIIPQLTTRLLKQEKYDDQGTVIKQTVLRIFLTKTFNILIQVVSYLLLQDPFLFTGLESPPQLLGEWHASLFKQFQFINLRSIFKKSFTTAKNSENTKADFANAGRVNQVGLNLFSFLYIAFATEIVMAFLFPGIAIITAKLKKKPLKKAQFDVALKMIGLLYFMQICLFTMPFMPLVGSIFIFLLYLKFKMEFFLTNRFGRKPKKAWAAKDSGEFFLKFYLVSIFIWIVINYLFLVTSTQPKTCSSQFKYLPETVELDGTKYTRMNLISQECDDLWHDLEGSSSKISAKDYLYDKYIELPAPCFSKGPKYVDEDDKECVPCPVDVTADENDQERCAGKTSTMQDVANLKYMVEKYWKEEEGYSWARSANEIRVNGMQIFLEREKGNSTLLTDQEVKNLESSFYKAAADKNINTEAKANDVKKTEKDEILAREKLTVRHSFRLWLDKVTKVELTGLSQVEEVQRKDLIQSPCSTSCASNSTYCATCGYNFAEKYKVLRDQKKYEKGGEDEDADANLNKKVEKSYSDVGITNNERMVMCACYKGVGPYSDSENGFQSVRELAAYYSILSVLYGALVNSSLFSWFVATTFCIALLFSKNSAAVSTDYAADQKYYFMDQITVLNKRNQNIQKKYNRLRMNIEG